MEDTDLPRPKGDAASRLASEDLAPYSQDELAARIALLETEIARVKQHSDQAARHRAAADALFGGSKSSPAPQKSGDQCTNGFAIIADRPI